MITPLLPREANDILVDLWHRVQHDGPSVTRADLRDAARRIVVEARDADLDASELIAALQVGWQGAGPREALIARPRFNRSILTALTSLCVAEYCCEQREDPPMNPLETRWHSIDVADPQKHLQ